MPSWLDSPVKEGYRMIRDSAGIAVRGAGFLSLEGPDIPDFLNRLSTNDLRGLEEGKLRATVLTNEKGRVIDLVIVLNMGGHILLLSSEGHSQGVKSWLEKYIIMEDIIVRDLTSSYKRISLIGPHAASILSASFGADPAGLEQGSFCSWEKGGVTLYRNPEWPVPLFDLVGAPEKIDAAVRNLAIRSNEQGTPPEVSPRAIEILRVESGVPRFDSEINDRINPLEAGLGRFVSFTKGCYIGQEVIARLDTYKKLQKSLRGFLFPRSSGDLSPGVVSSRGVAVGWTTSHIVSCALGKQLALGYLRLIPGIGPLSFSRADSTEELPVELLDLPLPASVSGGPPPK
jgi:tRNA-modifying protein YgfZ